MVLWPIRACVLFELFYKNKLSFNWQVCLGRKRDSAPMSNNSKVHLHSFIMALQFHPCFWDEGIVGKHEHNTERTMSLTTIKIELSWRLCRLAGSLAVQRDCLKIKKNSPLASKSWLLEQTIGYLQSLTDNQAKLRIKRTASQIFVGKCKTPLKPSPIDTVC